MMIRAKIAALLVAAVVAGAAAPSAAGSPVAVEIGDGSATVSVLDGEAWVLKGGTAPEAPVGEGASLAPGDQVRTGPSSRLELELPDGSFLRFDERTSFTLLSSGYREQDERRDIRVRMILGKVWARVSRLLLGRGRFSLQTPTAVAGVRGTVYRLNLNTDRSAVVKVYDGEVEVRRQAEGLQAEDGPGPLQAPKPVAGPHPVGMQEWVYIVRTLQQININPDGTATRPFRFDVQADLNDWVRWNQMRDEKIRKMREKLQR